MKKLLQRLAIGWIALMGIVGIYKEKLGRNEEKDEKAPQQKEVVLDEFEFLSFHNS
jgi:hypothetical protein